MEYLTQLPYDIINDWRASLERQVNQSAKGHFYLTGIRRTQAGGFEEQRVIVSVLDNDGFPKAGVPVAFSYSTADQFLITPDFLWQTPAFNYGNRAFVVPTGPAGTIDQVQGSGVKEGEPGGVSVFMLTPQYSSDVVRGVGMLASHAGLHLTFQLHEFGKFSLVERVKQLEDKVARLEKGQR